MEIEVLDSAKNDLKDGFSFYEEQAEGLGDHFLDCLEMDIGTLVIHGGVHRKSYGYHRALSKRFPYAVYYERTKDLIKVWAILDCRRDPKWIRKRLGG